jgi:hypothetical protein
MNILLALPFEGLHQCVIPLNFEDMHHSHLESKLIMLASNLQSASACKIYQSQSHIATDGQSVSQSVCLGVEPNMGL